MAKKQLNIRNDYTFMTKNTSRRTVTLFVL